MQVLGGGAAFLFLGVKVLPLPAGAVVAALQEPHPCPGKPSVILPIGGVSSDQTDCEGSAQPLFPEHQSYPQAERGKPGPPPSCAAVQK